MLIKNMCIRILCLILEQRYESNTIEGSLFSSGLDKLSSRVPPSISFACVKPGIESSS